MDSELDTRKITDQDLEELIKILNIAGPKCRLCLACAGKASSGVRFQSILGLYQVFVDPSVEGIELRNGDGSIATKVKP